VWSFKRTLFRSFELISEDTHLRTEGSFARFQARPHSEEYEGFLKPWIGLDVCSIEYLTLTHYQRIQVDPLDLYEGDTHVALEVAQPPEQKRTCNMTSTFHTYTFHLNASTQMYGPFGAVPYISVYRTQDANYCLLCPVYKRNFRRTNLYKISNRSLKS